ncbi:MAG: response regulator transcription factor [Chitinophagaceae bacterium]|nr:response regulator transcription factor [Chitinophagaceae bacterium]
MKIMVVDDHVPSLLKISGYINSLKGYRMLGMAHDGHELIKFCCHQKELPDIVLLDVQMQKMDGVTAMEFMGSYFPAVKIIAISSHIDERVVSDMLASGAWGYVFKDKEMSMLYEALLAVESNQPYVDRRLFFDISQRGILIKQRQAEKEWLFKQYGLSPREKEILALLVSNMDYREIGEILNIVPKTIEHTVNNLTKKFDITNGRAGLLLQSLRLGLTKMANLQGGGKII